MLARRESFQEITNENSPLFIRMSTRYQMRIAIFSSQKDEAVVGQNRNDEPGDFFQSRLIVERRG